MCVGWGEKVCSVYQTLTKLMMSNSKGRISALKEPWRMETRHPKQHIPRPCNRLPGCHSNSCLPGPVLPTVERAAQQMQLDMQNFLRLRR